MCVSECVCECVCERVCERKGSIAETAHPFREGFPGYLEPQMLLKNTGPLTGTARLVWHPLPLRSAHDLNREGRNTVERVVGCPYSSTAY